MNDIRCPECGHRHPELTRDVVTETEPDGKTYYDHHECERCGALMRVEVTVEVTVDVRAASAEDCHEWAADFAHQEWANQPENVR